MPYEISELERMIGESRQKVDSLGIQGYWPIRYLWAIPLSFNKIKITKALDSSESMLPKLDDDMRDRFGAELDRFMEDSHPQYCPVTIELTDKHTNALFRLGSVYADSCRYPDRIIYEKSGKVLFQTPFGLDPFYVSAPQSPKRRPSCSCTA